MGYIFWNITQCSLLKVNRRFEGICSFYLQGRISQVINLKEVRIGMAVLVTCLMLVSCVAYSSNLKMEATCPSEKSVDFQQTTRRYISEDTILHNHRFEYLKYYISNFVFQRFCLLFLNAH
jgi:hypothetical protein